MPTRTSRRDERPNRNLFRLSDAFLLPEYLAFTHLALAPEAGERLQRFSRRMPRRPSIVGERRPARRSAQACLALLDSGESLNEVGRASAVIQVRDALARRPTEGGAQALRYVLPRTTAEVDRAQRRAWSTFFCRADDARLRTNL